MAEVLRRAWITRAAPAAHRSAERVAAMGFEPVVSPLLHVRPLAVAVPDLDDFAAIAFTSLNGVAAFVALTPRRDRPVLAVGDATALAAREAGFDAVASARGDVHDLAALIAARAPSGAVLHPRARIPAADLGALSAPVTVIPLDVYETLETAGPAPEAFDVVLLHSPRAAHALTRRLAPEAARWRSAVVLSANVAAPLADLPFAEILIADTPDEAALIAALGKARSGL